MHYVEQSYDIKSELVLFLPTPIVKSYYLLWQKSSIIQVCLGSKYASFKYMLYFFVLSPLGFWSKYKDKYSLETRDIFRTQPSIQDGTFWEKGWWTSAVNYFLKKLHLRCLTLFCICLWNLNYFGRKLSILNVRLGSEYAHELLTIFAKSFILHVWLSSRYASNMFKDRQNICDIPVNESFLEMFQAKTEKWFLRNLRKTLLRNNFLQN